MADAGFIFWGLFLVFAMIVVAYIAWMIQVERADSGKDGRDGGAGEEDSPAHDSTGESGRLPPEEGPAADPPRPRPHDA